MLWLFLVALVSFFVLFTPPGPPYPYGRAPINEWTEFNEDGRPVRGVGRRGYWVNETEVGADWPFRRCKCGPYCSGWVSNKTGEHAKVMNLKEALAFSEHAKGSE